MGWRGWGSWAEDLVALRRKITKHALHLRFEQANWKNLAAVWRKGEGESLRGEHRN